MCGRTLLLRLCPKEAAKRPKKIFKTTFRHDPLVLCSKAFGVQFSLLIVYYIIYIYTKETKTIHDWGIWYARPGTERSTALPTKVSHAWLSKKKKKKKDERVEKSLYLAKKKKKTREWKSCCASQPHSGRTSNSNDLSFYLALHIYIYTNWTICEPRLSEQAP